MSSCTINPKPLADAAGVLLLLRNRRRRSLLDSGVNSASLSACAVSKARPTTKQCPRLRVRPSTASNPQWRPNTTPDRRQHRQRARPTRQRRWNLLTLCATRGSETLRLRTTRSLSLGLRDGAGDPLHRSRRMLSRRSGGHGRRTQQPSRWYLPHHRSLLRPALLRSPSLPSFSTTL
jgi:hypothetical protein